MAEQDPQRNWLGIEVHRPGVGHLLLEIERRGLTNLRLIRHDAVEVLARRHRARQPGPRSTLLSRPLAETPPSQASHPDARADRAARARAALGRVFHAATDWEPYAEQMLEILEASSTTFENLAGPGGFSPRPATRPLTRFEQRGERLGHRVRDLMFRRR
jgi:tRNA (guanine-N7-)-methyltransferase